VMPEMSGFDLAKSVRETRPDTKVLFMSGYTDRRVGGGWVLDASTPFLHKPFTATALAKKVREALDTPVDGAPTALEALLKR
jgi:two-component system, cell cycle sensor histidine kinase and response regulator CckA